MGGCGSTVLWVDLWLPATTSWTRSRWRFETAPSNKWTLIYNCQIAYYNQLWNLSPSPYTYSWDSEDQWKQSYQKHILIKRKELVNNSYPGSCRSKSLGCQSGVNFPFWILTLCWPIWGVSEWVSEWTQQPCWQHLRWWMNNPSLQVRDIAACNQKATKSCQPYTQRCGSLLAKAGRTFCGSHHHHHDYFH